MLSSEVVCDLGHDLCLTAESIIKTGSINNGYTALLIIILIIKEDLNSLTFPRFYKYY